MKRERERGGGKGEIRRRLFRNAAMVVLTMHSTRERAIQREAPHIMSRMQRSLETLDLTAKEKCA